jgi:hypothetical protein
VVLASISFVSDLTYQSFQDTQDFRLEDRMSPFTSISGVLTVDSRRIHAQLDMPYSLNSIIRPG